MFHNAAPIAANVLQPCLPISYELIVNFPHLFLQKTGITRDSFEKFYEQISAQNTDDHLITSWQSYRTRARGMTDKNRLFCHFPVNSAG